MTDVKAKAENYERCVVERMKAATDRVGRNDRLSPGGGEEMEK